MAKENSQKIILDKGAIVKILEEIATLMEIRGENGFKIRAYANGARVLQQAPASLEEICEAGGLEAVDGIGDALALKIRTLAAEGNLPFYDKLRASVPPGLLEMLDIPGVGGKTIRRLHEELGITDIASLQLACVDGRVAALKGFGQKSQEKILSGIANRAAYQARHLWEDAERVAQPILQGLRALPEVCRAEAAGSLRRLRETVGDLDFLVGSEQPEQVMQWFVSRPEVAEVTARGSTKSSVRLRGGLQADLRVVPDRQFAYALHHFTGSKDHNVLMRKRALSRGWSMSEWGLTPLDGQESEPVEAADEAALFAALGLPWIAPELREGIREIERAEEGGLPVLLEQSDIRGALHNHTRASDGADSLVDMIAAAEAMGWEYIGIADHSQSSVQANGLSAERLLEQVAKIREINRSGRFQVHVLAGVECDILKDGALDYPDEVLVQLDYVVASLHQPSPASQPHENTRRIVRALEHPAVTLLAHPTGRLLLKREPYPMDIAQVIDAAAANGKWIEINANSHRLDLDWRHWEYALEKGVMACINPDAHSARCLRDIRFGVHVARKAGLTAAEVANTRGWNDFARMLRL